MYSYQCNVCGYVYDPDDGDEDQGVDPDTDFEELPESWACPQCGNSPDNFHQL